MYIYIYIYIYIIYITLYIHMDFTSSNDSKGNPRYLLTHFDRFQALIIILCSPYNCLCVVHV